MRKSITYLQSASQLSRIEGKLTPDMIFELAGVQLYIYININYYLSYLIIDN